MEKKIIKRLKEGDAEAFDAIYRQFSQKMYNFAYGIVKDQDAVKDLVQEVFITLWEKRSKVNPDLNFDNYIFTMVYNAIRKFFRKRAIENRFVDELLKNSPEKIDGSDAELIYKELHDLASKAIDNLPPKRKAVYKLSKQEGLKIKEIARRLNISPRTAEHQLAKALKTLKEELSGISLLAMLFFHLFVK